jgi:hypothetical protein
VVEEEEEGEVAVAAEEEEEGGARVLLSLDSSTSLVCSFSFSSDCCGPRLLTQGDEAASAPSSPSPSFSSSSS